MTKRMMFVMTVIGAASVLGFFLAGCEQGGGDSSRTSTRSLLTLGAADNGTSWIITKNSQLVVNLSIPSVTGTGYVWQVSADKSVLDVASMPSTDDAMSLATASFSFVAREVGITTLGIYYQRPSSAAVTSFMVTIRVED